MVHLFLPFFFLIKCTLSIVISSVSKPTFACRKTSSFVLLSSHVSLFTRDISLMPINRKLFLRCLSSSSAICSFILVFYSNKFWTSSLFLLSVSGFCFSSVMSCFIFSYVSFWNSNGSCNAFTSPFSGFYSSCMLVILDSKFSILFVKVLIIVFSWISSNSFCWAIVKLLAMVLFSNVFTWYFLFSFTRAFETRPPLAN